MDLWAYGQMEDVDWTRMSEETGIDVDRMRGIRMMERTGPFSKEVLDKCLNEMIGSYWWLANWRIDHDEHTEQDYIDGYRPASVPDRHRAGCDGWSMFMEISMLKARFHRQYRIWNQYAGQKDTLYLHARMGGKNWKHYYSDKDREKYDIHDGYWVEEQPWFLCKCDDAYDPTYCDIYARLPEGYVIPYKEADRWAQSR